MTAPSVVSKGIEAAGTGTSITPSYPLKAFGLHLGTSSVSESPNYLHGSRLRNDIESAWELRAALTHQAGDLPGAVYNGKFYVFGGYGTGATDYLNYTQIYNPSTDTWTQGATMPTARWGAAAAAYNGKIYVFGGTAAGGASNKCEIYDIAGDSWTTGTNLPTAVGNGLMAVTVGSKIYIFYYNLVYEFDPAANGGLGSYTAKTAPPSAAQKKWATCAYVSVGGEDRIYLIGGSNSSEAYLDNNYYYRPGYNDWSSAQAAAPYTAHGVTRDNPVYNGKIYYALGWRGSTRFYSKIYAYNPSNNTWSGNLGVSPSRGKDGMACGVIDGRLYIAGGRDDGTSPHGLTEHEVFLINKTVNLTYTLTKLEVYFPSVGSGNVRIGIYADDSRLPGNLLLDAGEATVAQGWVAISGLSLEIGLDYYWIVLNMSASNSLRYVSGMPEDSHVWRSYTYGALPSTFGTPDGGETTKFVARATLSGDAVLANDIIYIAVISHQPNGIGVINTPSGFTQASQDTYRNSTPVDAGRAALFWKRASGGESGTISITRTGDTGSDTCFFAQVFVVRGCATSGDPFDAVVAKYDGDGAATLTWPAVTVSGNERTLLAFCVQADEAPGVSMIVTYTRHREISTTTTGTDAQINLDDKANVSTDGSVSADNGETNGWVTFHVSAQPVLAASFKDISTRFKLWVQGYRDVAARFNIWAQGYLDIATRFKLIAQAYKDSTTRFRLTVQGYRDTATRFLLTVGTLAYKDIATRFKLWVQNYRDIATRFFLGLPYYKDTSGRFKLTVQAYRDTVTRFKLWAQVYKDILTRFRLWVQNYEDIASRFKLTAQGYLDVPTRYKLFVQAYSDIATRFILTVQAYKDIATRFILTLLGYKDVAIRFILTVGTLAYRDIAARFKLVVQGFQDIATHFSLNVQGFQDVATRFLLLAQGYKDAATRFILTVQGYKDATIRFILQTRGYQDAATRFLLNAQNYKDVTSRFIIQVRNYKDIATRFLLNVQGYKDIVTRFRLVVTLRFIDVASRFSLSAQAYRDVSARFFLYVPTWKELQVQQEIANLQGKVAELELALEPKAHFRI